MGNNWLDTQHRGFSAYLEETGENPSCKAVNRSIACASTAAENVDTVLLDCKVSTDWIENIEAALPFLENAVRQNRQFILRQGETVPIERAKRVSRASVEHLSRHSELITTEPQPQEELRPDKIYITENVGTYTIYENRFLYMLLCYLRDFAGLRYQKILALAASFSSDIAISKKITDRNRTIQFQLNYSEIAQGGEDSDSQAAPAIQRIKSILQATELLLRTELMKEVSLAPLLKPPISRTNVMLHDPNFKVAFELYRFLSEYTQDGYEKLERYRHSGTPDEEVKQDFAALISVTSYLSYRVGGLREELEERFQTEQQRRKEEAARLNREKLAALKQQLGELNGPACEYILALEQQLRALEEKDIQTEQEKALRLEAEARLEAAGEQLDALRAAAAELEGTLQQKTEENRSLTRENEQIQQQMQKQLQQAEERMEQQRQQLTQELEQQKQQFLREYEDLAEKYRLARARSRQLSSEDGECCTKEAFAELEQEFEAFRRFYEQQWKLTKKQIRKEKLWHK